MLELNKKLDVEFEDFHGSRIYYIPDFYKDPDEIKEVLDLVEPEYFKGDQNGAYNRVHFHDMRHKIPCSNIGFVNKVLSNLCEQIPYEEVSIQTNCHKFVKNEFNDYENYYWWPHQDTGYVGLVYFNRDDDECGTNLYEVLDPEEPEKKRWVQEHTEPWRDKEKYRVLKHIPPVYNMCVLFDGLHFPHGMNICNDRYFGDELRVNQFLQFGPP